MSDSIALSLGQKFEIERMGRVIDSTTDLDELRSIAKQLLQAWHTQKAATNWILRENLSKTPPVYLPAAEPAPAPEAPL
jgi:hypothetical protein